MTTIRRRLEDVPGVAGVGSGGWRSKALQDAGAETMMLTRAIGELEEPYLAVNT
jgi:hypothetical protein